MEGAHARLKRLLQDSMGDLCCCWNAINNMIILQHTEIRASFQQSINTVEHRHTPRLFQNLRNFVSRSALGEISDQYEQVKYVGVDSSLCGCRIRTTHGIPCSCQIAKYVTLGMCPIPLGDVHIHWRKLSFDDVCNEDRGPALMTLSYEMDKLLNKFESLDIYGKQVMKGKVLELVFPETTSMCPPPEKVIF